MYYISRYWYPLVYRPIAYLSITAVLIVFTLCSDPVILCVVLGSVSVN
jgi:hypothetical protein